MLIVKIQSLFYFEFWSKRAIIGFEFVFYSKDIMLEREREC